ncbi:DUF4268 domain-containing protein [Acidovorax sp. FG27]|uniref:DUF4268 domain-containing protein n=1 Tax=Acidovorax sp. FG27 TaxID=3133652 RepID=UPI0033416AFB
MFRIDQTTNRIIKLSEVSFSELRFTERHHLQEWIANQPDVLGEDLLIIQKEFDGFDDTKERLDLLALDKAGRLVIIENKLDDSGKDVVWQALKYASYCSTLSKSGILKIFQLYLEKNAPEASAEKLICEFLGKETIDDVVLNIGNEQRLVMVAAKFRKEVTSTVLWLMKHRISVTCFQATPFREGDNVFLTVKQVIPLPEAEELMIGISEKEDEEQSAELRQAARHQMRTEFWHAALAALKEANVTLFDKVSPGRDHWLSAGSGVSGIGYSLIFNRNEIRVEFTIDVGSKESNKLLFDELFARKAEVELSFGSQLNWRRMDDKKVSIIQTDSPCDGHDRSNWPAMAQWLACNIAKLEKAFSKEIPSLRNSIKLLQAQQSAADPSTAN